MPTPSLLALGNEAVPAGEPQAIQQIIEVCNDLLDLTTSPVPRQQHGKGHGVVRAELRVSPNVPPELRQGVFREPRVFQALVRFSNGGERSESDKDAHGMAIKLFDVSGAKILEEERDATTQDFILLDSPTFFIRDAVEYAVFAVALRAAVRWSRTGWRASAPEKLRKLALFAHLFWNYLRTRPYERRLFLGVRRDPPASALVLDYWSTTPYKLGPHAVRWSARPDKSSAPPGGGAASALPREDRLRAGLMAHLDASDATFELLAQRQTDATAMPVEDSTIPWDERVSKPVVLATLHISRQEFDTPRRRALGEHLSFSPWHSLPEHRPLGGINRARGAIYAALSKRRRELNHATAREPDLRWLTSEWDGGGAGSLPVSAPPLGNTAKPTAS